MKLGVVDEVSFTIPTQIERNHQLIDNPLIKKIKHRYLFKLVYNRQTQYFIFHERDKEYGDDEFISYRGYGLGYQLADKDIRGYKVMSKSLTEIIYDILKETNWKIGYVDGYFDTKIRSHEIDQSTVLQAMYDLAEKFNAVIIWDTRNLTISMYNPSNIGMNKGLRLKPGKYLESFSLTDNSEEVVTRLKLYGQDGLTIRKLTPTGANYLEDFSWFLHPFERDGKGKVLKSSDYMSDSLAIALEDYNLLLANLQGQFNTLLQQLLSKQDEIQIESQRLSVLLSDLAQLLDERDVYNSAGDGDINDINNRINAKESEISASESFLSRLVAEEKSIQANIDSLRVQTSIETHLSGAQLLELNNFIITKEYTNDAIVDEEDLLKDGIEAFERFREPSISLSMNIVNFLSNIESQNNHDKLGLGDTISVGNERLNVDIKAKIIEIEFDFDNEDVNLQIANERDYKDSDARFLDMIYSANNTSNTVNMNKFKWDLVEEANSMVSQMLNSEWDATKRKIVAGYEQSIVISERGIIIKSPEDPMDVLVIQNGMLAISNDGMNTWKHAITANGVIGDRIIGRLLIGARLLIEDEGGIIKIDGSTQTIYDPAGNDKVLLGRYGNASDDYGLLIKNGGIRIENGLPENQISSNATNKWNSAEGNAKNYADGKDSAIRGDLRLTAPLPTSIAMNRDGITATASGSSSFARMDHRGLFISGGALDIRTGQASNRGVIIDGNGISGYNSSGGRVFHVDTNGNLTANSGTFSGSLNGANITGANGSFSGNLSGATGTFSGNLNFAGGTFTGTLSGVNGNFSGNLTGNSISGATISGGTINGTTITGGTINIGSGNFTVDSSGVGRIKTNLEVGNTVHIGDNNLNALKTIHLGGASASWNRSRIEHNSSGLYIASGGVNMRLQAGASMYILGGTGGYLEMGQGFDGGVFNMTSASRSPFQFRGFFDYSQATVTGLNATAVLG